MAWIQLIFRNTLLHTFSVIDFPRPKCGVFCILIVAIILISTLVVFSLLCASNYHDKNGSVCDVLPLYSNNCYIELPILIFLYFCDIHQCSYISYDFLSTYDDFITCIVFSFKISRNFAFITNIKSVHL